MSTYAVADLHGSMSGWKAIQGFLNESDTLYILGDAADRGPDGYAIWQEAMNDPRVIYVRGNHDQFAIETLVRKNQGLKEFWVNHPRVSGKPTYLAAMQDDPEERRRTLNWLAATPLYVEYLNLQDRLVVLTHAGFTPKKFQRDVYVFPENREMFEGREHFHDSWPKEQENVYVVHGHTPIESGYFGCSVEPGRALFYADGHKVCIDVGTNVTGRVLLLDLDSFEEVVYSESTGWKRIAKDKVDMSISDFVFVEDADGAVVRFVYDWHDNGVTEMSRAVKDLEDFGVNVVKHGDALLTTLSSEYRVLGHMFNAAKSIDGAVWCTGVVKGVIVEDGKLFAITGASKYQLLKPM